MTDKNADVEWLRRTLSHLDLRKLPDDHRYWFQLGTGRRILVHIDQLEAERVKDQLRIEELQSSVDGCAQRLAAEVSRRSVPDDRRPTVHEIAAQIFVGWVRITGRPSDELLAASAYKAAEALVAEGGRRDGLRK